jgi:hypothetical protein
MLQMFPEVWNFLKAMSVSFLLTLNFFPAANFLHFDNFTPGYWVK